MWIGFMLDWKRVFPIQSPLPTIPLIRKPHHHPCSVNREASFESARDPYLIPQESEILHEPAVKAFEWPFGSLHSLQSSYVEMEEVNISKKFHWGAHKLSRPITTHVMDEASCSASLLPDNSLQFNLLMENIDRIEDILVDSNLIRLERDILAQVGRLGALKLFHACLSRTLTGPDAPNPSFLLTKHFKGLPVDFQFDNQRVKVYIRSKKKELRKLRRERTSEKAARMSAMPSSTKVIHSVRKFTDSAVTDLGRLTSSSKSRNKRNYIARNESEMSVGVKEIANLERTLLKLEQKMGRLVSLANWAEAAGLDEKTLLQRLHFGWHCKDRLIRSTRSLVVYLAKSYKGMGIGFDDLIQAGNMGVLQGAERFDNTRGYRLSTYVQYWIRKSMLALVARHSRGIQIPVTMEKIIKRIQKVRRAFYDTEGRYPEDDEIAELAGLSLAKVRLAGKRLRVVSLSDKIYGDDLKIKVMEMIADPSIKTPEEIIMRQHMRRDIFKLLERLLPRERQVLLLRYGIRDGRSRSLEEIGRLFKVTKEWIRKIEKAALTKIGEDEVQGELRHYLRS